MVKYTTSLPCIGLSESDLKLVYINSTFCKGKITNIWENTLIYKSNLCWTKIFKKSLHVLEDGASSVQVDILDI